MNEVGALPGGHMESNDCWCAPDIYKLCPEDCEDGCWRCEDKHPGWVRASPGDDADLLIVHRHFDDA